MTTDFRIQYIAITTKHWKEDVIAPPFRKYLGATLIAPRVDTDQLRAEAGEGECKGAAFEIALLKARVGMQATDLPYGLASEGVFATDPLTEVAPFHAETLVYADDERGFCLREELKTGNTNYSRVCVDTLDQGHQFLALAKFPSHGVILSPNRIEGRAHLSYDAISESEFESAFAACKAGSMDGKVRLETDMRAFRNPTRMRVIGVLAWRMAKRLATPCPCCQAPGWGVVRLEGGAPCRQCGKPNSRNDQEVYGCALCLHEAIQMHDNWMSIDPASCHHRNL